jgi:hypothetical protein
VNPDVILDRFRHISPDSLESVSSGSTAYSAEDWLKACTTLQVEVKDSRSVGARKLGQNIHHLSCQVELLQVEVDGLRKKLYQNRKRQKQPNRQLDLQQHQEYHGGAIMWSPRAFREARARIAVAEQDAQEEELKNAETRELPAANKIYKEKIAEEKWSSWQGRRQRESRPRQRSEQPSMRARIWRLTMLQKLSNYPKEVIV